MKIYLEHPGIHIRTTWLRNVLQFSQYTITNNLHEADIVCVLDITTNNAFQNNNLLLQLAKKHAKLVVFIHDDPDEIMPHVDNVCVFRTSINKQIQQTYEHVLPSFQCQRDAVFANGFQPCTQQTICVGFIGASTSPDRNMLINKLQNDTRFKTDFVLRRIFHEHYSKEEQAKHKQEYVQNIINNQYQLCPRGAGNFSHRFYEVLAAGRIPIILTSLALPENVPQWDRYVVRASDINTVPDALFAFHHSKNIVDTQIQCRKLWLDYLSLQGFAKHFDSTVTQFFKRHEL